MPEPRTDREREHTERYRCTCLHYARQHLSETGTCMECLCAVFRSNGRPYTERQEPPK